MPTSAAAARAAFYGSVSAVTFTAAMTVMERGDHPVEGFMASLRGRGHAMNDLVPFGRAR